MPGGGADAAGFMSGFSPLGLMAAGGLLSGPQQYMQQRMGWIKTNMTGGTMSALFNISPSYGGRGGQEGGRSFLVRQPHACFGIAWASAAATHAETASSDSLAAQLP
jgi:hypothetical protein